MTSPNDADRNDALPGDARLARAFRLAAGDLPPTSPRSFESPASHQPGQIDKRVILQSAWWVDRLARWHRLDDMSPAYRGNVLGFLDRESPAWLYQAAGWTLLEAIYQAITPAEASARLELLELLTPGWTGHTSLGRRLHHLNGTRPSTLPPPPALLTAAETSTPQILRDHDRGLWRAHTESTATYLIDLDRRRILRKPGDVAAREAGNGQVGVRSKLLPYDEQWSALAGLIQCRTGRPLIVLHDRPIGGGYRTATTVTRIEGIYDPPLAGESGRR